MGQAVNSRVRIQIKLLTLRERKQFMFNNATLNYDHKDVLIRFCVRTLRNLLDKPQLRNHVFGFKCSDTCAASVGNLRFDKSWGLSTSNESELRQKHLRKLANDKRYYKIERNK